MPTHAESLALHTDSFFISPYAFSAYIALKEKGLPFQLVPTSLALKEHQTAAYQAQSITGRVPALRHGDFWLAESNAIIDYLEEAFPGAPSLLPKDVRQRARARQVLAWIRSDLMPIREERGTVTMFYQRATEPLSPKAREAADNLVRVASLLIPDGQTSLFGPWSIADSDLSFMLHRLILNGHEVPPKVRAFAETQWKRPTVQEWVHIKRIPYQPY